MTKLGNGSRFLAFALSLLLLLLSSFIPLAASAEMSAAGDLRIDASGAVTWHERGTADLVIPEFVNGIRVTAISGWLFQGDVALRSITLPAGLVTIGDYAFDGCVNLETVRIPSGVQSIGEYAFRRTPWLEENPNDFVIAGDGVLVQYNGSATDVVIPASVKTIGSHAFPPEEVRIARVRIPEGVTAIGDYAFVRSALATVDLPDSLRTIGMQAFFNTSITSAHIPASVVGIGIQAFDNFMPVIQGMTVDASNSTYASRDGVLFDKSGRTLISHPSARTGSYTVPDGVTRIETGAFMVSQLSEIQLPDSLESIGDSAFLGCENLTSLHLPARVRSIDGHNVFATCPQLRLTVSPENTHISVIDDILYGDQSLIYCPSWKTGSVTVPDNVTAIVDFGFSYCSQVTEILLPEGLDSIGSQAFLNCGALTTISLPASLTWLSAAAFDGCHGLESIWFNGDLPSSNAAMSLFMSPGEEPDGFILYHAEGTTGFDEPWNTHRTETFVPENAGTGNTGMPPVAATTRTIPLAVPAQVLNGRTMVPLRDIAEALGCEIRWVGDTNPQTVTLVRGDKTVRLSKTPGSTMFSREVVANGIPRTLDVPAQILNASTCVPVRFISESLDYLVDYDEVHQEIVVMEPKATGKTIVLKVGGRQARILQGTYEAGLRRMALHLDKPMRTELLNTITPDMPMPQMPRFFLDERTGAQICIVKYDGTLTIPQIQAQLIRNYRDVVPPADAIGYLSTYFLAYFSGTDATAVHSAQANVPGSFSTYDSDRTQVLLFDPEDGMQSFSFVGY